ncbi:hypothetical protein BJX63DRAFT_41048 [Aspergillus granulosus]|uniref:Uncharacterized protein n=1 Tax=Aspergillus granulosus TaxID=176169 RepID=A0ABR4GYB5_9EURO
MLLARLRHCETYCEAWRELNKYYHFWPSAQSRSRGKRMFLTKPQTQRPATDYERWLNKSSPDSESIPQFEPESEPRDDMHNHGEQHSVIPSGGIEPMNGFDYYDPSNVPLPAQQDATRWPRVPDIITYYGALLILLLFVKYFVKTLFRQLRQRSERADHQFATRHPHQVPSIVVEDNELKRG